MNQVVLEVKMIRKSMVVLLITGICLLGAIPALAQRQYATLEEYEKVTGKKITKLSEAPILRTKVAAGELPPVEERLPKEPMVVEPIEEIGQYGGNLRTACLGTADVATIYVPFLTEPLVRWDRTGTVVIPNVAKKWSISKDARTYTFYLRKGMKWSDGTPLTADDILFWYKDIALNKELTPVFYSWLTTGGEPVEVKKIDDYTVQFRFSQTNVLFLKNVAFQGSMPWSNMITPKHYLKQFHPNYVPKEKLITMTKEAGFDHWFQLFLDKKDYVQNSAYPVITAWQSTGSMAGRTLHTLKRNPYYWKVDPHGNQLPYLTWDTLSSPIIRYLRREKKRGVTAYSYGRKQWAVSYFSHPI